jgi:hypothetical protein
VSELLLVVAVQLAVVAIVDAVVVAVDGCVNFDCALAVAQALHSHGYV